MAIFKMQQPAQYTAFLFVILLMSSPAALSSRLPAAATARGGSERLLNLAMYWPTSLCNGQTKCENFPPARFTIHRISLSDRVEPCDSNPIDWANFPPNTIARMEHDWASYGSYSNHGFWEHEWALHGRCSGLLPESYFRLGLNVFETVNLTARLRAEQHGKYFPNGQTVETEEFRKVISGLAGEKDVVLLCNTDESGVSQLYQIDVCVDDDTNNYADCPTSSSSRACQGNIRLTKPLIAPAHHAAHIPFSWLIETA